MTELDYNIIATGSTGNAVRIENMMFDCGIPYKDMKEELYKVDSLFITHSHSDHVKPATLAAIHKDFPRIKVYANANVAYQFDVDVVVGTAKIKLKKNRVVIPFDGVHDVPVTGYIIQMKGMNILYMTDTSVIKMPEDLPLDYVFLESNYDETKLRTMAKQYKRHGYNPLESSLRHLSTQKCKEFYFVHRRNKDSQLIELHMSHRFY